MAGIDRIIDGVRDVIKMTDEIRRLSDGMKELAVEVREMDRRLIRLETMVEIARSHTGGAVVAEIEEAERD